MWRGSCSWGGTCPLPFGMPSPVPAIHHHCGLPAPAQHDGAPYTVVRVADAMFVSFLGALPTAPFYSALTPLGMDEWPEATPLAPLPPNAVDDTASEFGA